MLKMAVALRLPVNYTIAHFGTNNRKMTVGSRDNYTPPAWLLMQGFRTVLGSDSKMALHEQSSCGNLTATVPWLPWDVSVFESAGVSVSCCILF